MRDRSSHVLLSGRFLIAIVAALSISDGSGVSAFEDVASFDRDIAPILIDNCLDCHSGAESKGGLDLSASAAALKGGESGTPLVAGNPAASLLWKRIDSGEMPPKKGLADRDRKVVFDWIRNGAKWGTSPIDSFRVTTTRRAGYDWWALQPLTRPAVPEIEAVAAVRNPIDAFVLERLAQSGLSPGKVAGARVLIRRLSFDLLGLPPSPDEVVQFESAYRRDRDAAISALVERLLESKHFGERWGRHWLDVVRFGESQGFERDKLRPNSWHYRDWVIRAMNDDMPYDEFVRLQLAGDVLKPDNFDAITATGFLVAAPWDEVGQSQRSPVMKAIVRQDELEDYVGTIGQTFLGLTVNCARCHDHKFDPIRQTEYYRLASAVGGVRHGSRKLIARDEQERVNELKGKLGPLRRQIAEIEGAVRKRLPQGAKRGAIMGAHTAEERKRRSDLEAAIKPLEDERRKLESRTVYAVMPGRVETTHLLHRGNPADRRDIVTPGGVASLAGTNAEFGLTADSSDADRRRKLAEWITDKRNPLFARVIVNRLWHYHFGTGLVETPNDFGFNGGRPSHPELIDWLAAELVEANFSLKHIHRLILTSATFLQSSGYRADCAAVDSDNRLLWRKAPLRLEAESLRDAILSVSGQLNPQFGGAPYQDFTTYVHNTQFYKMTDPDTPDVYRRTVYRTWIRSGRNHLLDAFDCPDPSTTAPQRAVTTTPIQALALMNNSFVLRMAERFAQRVITDAGDDTARQVARVYQLAYGRSPGDSETEPLADFVHEHGLPAFCRVVLNSNEFIHVD